MELREIMAREPRRCALQMRAEDLRRDGGLVLKRVACESPRRETAGVARNCGERRCGAFDVRVEPHRIGAPRCEVAEASDLARLRRTA